MTAISSTEDNQVTVKVTGALDFTNTSELGEIISHACLDKPLTIDLTETLFMDSSTLTLLLREAKRRGGLTIRVGTPQVKRVLDLVGVSDILNVVDASQESA